MKKIWIIVFLGLLIYGLALFNGFVWDDEVMFNNFALSSVYFRPAVSAIYSIIYNLFGQQPFFFHFFQLAFHIATVIFVFYFFKRFFNEMLSLILALIFLVHPANVEAVSFISAMQETAFTLTGIIGLYLFVIPTEMEASFQVFSATLLLLIALLMKETAIVFFPLVFCYLLLFKRKQTKVLIGYSIFAVILLAGYLLFRLTGGNTYVQGQGLFPIMRVSLATRLMNIPSIILYYITKFFYPMNLAIAQHWVVKTVDFWNFWWPLMFQTTLFLGTIIYFIKTKSKVFIFFFIWFLLGLLPHLQIIPLNMTVAERWLYFPMIGLLGMAGAVLKESRIKNQELRIVYLGIIIILIFSIRSFVRTLDWRNGLTLFSRDIRRDSSFDLQNNMGVELFRAGRYEEAKKYFEISTKLAPYWWVNWNNLGAVYEWEKNYPKAIEYYQKSINNGQYYLAYENLARNLALHGKDKNKTKEFLRKALKLFPKNENLLRINALLIGK